MKVTVKIHDSQRKRFVPVVGETVRIGVLEDMYVATPRLKLDGIQPNKRSALKLPISHAAVLVAPEGTPLLLMSPP